MSSSKSSVELECTRKCRSKNHISVLTSALTKRSVSDAELASYLQSTCYNFLRGVDREGRSILHMIASRGRRCLLEWLVKGMLSGNTSQGTSLLDVRDLESGYTPLHRSIYYGQINTSVLLMEKGASLTVLDYDDYTPLDHALLDRPPRFELNKDMPCEAYVWGTNNNYTSGTGSQHQRVAPELLTMFTKLNMSIKQVCISKFHSVFVSACGSVWSCGHGEGGRLGTMAGGTCVLPTRVPMQEPCVQVAAARDHTIFLMHSGLVMSCGLNTHYQLGLVPPPPNVLAPRATRLKLASARGVWAGRYHSVAYSARALYTWGLNGGQLGHSKEDVIVVAPKKVLRFGDDSSLIEHVSASDGATVVATNKGDVYLLYQYQCKRIITGQHNMKSLEVVGGEVAGGDKMTDYQKKLSVLVLYSSGSISLWQDSTNTLTRCIFSINRPVWITSAALTREYIMVVTKQGEAFQGSILFKKTKVSKTPSNKETIPMKDGSHFNKFIDKDECVNIKLKRLPNIHRAVTITGDMNGNNFAVLQVNPNSCLVELPQITSSQLSSDMLTLIQEADEYDLVHDVIVKVGSNTFPAHKFVLCNGSEYFIKLCTLHNDGCEKNKKLIIVLENVHPEIAKRMLEYLYTGTCDLLVLGPCKLEIKREPSIPKDSGSSEIIMDSVGDGNKSAFEVYKNTKKDKNKKIAKQKSSGESEFSDLYDPVRLLQEAAKKFQVTALYKLLSKYCFSNGYICLKEKDRRHAVPKLTFNRNSVPELWDTEIRCEDKQIIKAHKCILSARLDYFNGMFAHSWTENSANSSVSLPIHSSLLEPIIDFLYTDECPKIGKTEDVEYLCNMLIIADQLFITRMREMCEEAFSRLINLKNVSEIFQLASTYNCVQLKQCCMEYMSLNLPTLLESKSLESTTPELLQDLTDYYNSYNPLMSNRVITPFYDAISDDELQISARLSPTDLNEEFKEEALDEIRKDLTLSNKKLKPRQRNTSFTESDKIRRRNESISSITSLDASYEDNKSKDVTLSLSRISNDSPGDKNKIDWVKVDSAKKKQNKIIEARLKAVTAAKENSDILNCQTDSFTTLYKHDSPRAVHPNSPPIQSPMASNNYISPYGSPTPTSPLLEAESTPRTTQATLNIVMDKKMSQKQRKKLALEARDLANHLDKLNFKKSVYDTPHTSSESDLVVQPVKNPWQKIESVPTTSMLKKKEDKMDFTKIVEDEKKQRDNFNKMMAKPLALTQLEDKAIDELLRYYTTSCGDEERISVRRVECLQIAAPQWINKATFK